MRVIIKQIIDWALFTWGSSRTSALIRIGLVFIIWTRWAHEMTFFYGSHDAYPLVLKILFFSVTASMLLGYHARLSSGITALILFGIYFYAGIVEHLRPEHHTYMLAIATALCACTPCGNSYSLDRWLAVMRAKRERLPIPAEWGNLWGLRLMSLQVSLMYFWTAYDKSTWAFLSGERLEAILMQHYTGSAYPDIPLFHALAIVASISVVLLEYALCFGLLFERTRAWFIVIGLFFHGLLYVTLPVLTFSVTVALMYLSYISADTIHRLIHTLHGNLEDTST